MSMSALSIGAGGMRAAANRFETSAARVSNPNSGADMATEMISIMQSKIEFEASAKIVKMAGDMQKSAIDILA